MSILSAPPAQSGAVRYVLLLVAAFVLYLAAAANAARSGWRISLKVVIVFAIIVQAILIRAPVERSTDVFRYLWEGEVALHGINPLIVPPSSSALIPLRGTVWTHVNNKTVSSVYPPVSQAAFAFSAWVAPGSVLVWKMFMGLCNLAAVLGLGLWLRERGIAPQRALLYAWNPLVLTEYALNGHQDALGIAVFCAALWMLERSVKVAGRRGAAPSRSAVFAGVLFALSIFSKGYAIVCLPFFLLRLRRKQGRAASFSGGVGVVSVLCAALLFWQWTPGRPLPWTGLRIFGLVWERNDLPFVLLRRACDPAIPGSGVRARAVAALLLVGIWLILYLRAGHASNGPAAEKDTTTPAALAAMGALLLLGPTVYPWYIPWLLPIAIGCRRWSWVALTGLVSVDYLNAALIRPSMALLALEYGLFAIAWIVEERRIRRRSRANTLRTPIPAPDIGVIIPALDEAEAIGAVVSEIPHGLARQIVVVDNGSSDGTAAAAAVAGARVIHEPERGYGAACQAGIRTLGLCDIVVFLDGDRSDFPAEMRELVSPIQEGRADLVIGSRMMGNREAGALLPHAVFGNWLFAGLLNLLYGQRASDLGPFRAIRRDALEALQMTDRGYGWTIEMQAKAAGRGLIALEVPVGYRRRIGRSKITGSLKASLRAGATILWVLLRVWLFDR